MNVASRKTLFVILLIAAFATGVFIIVHSLQASDSSWGESNVIAALFEPVLRVMYGGVNKVFALLGHGGALSYGVFVRKLAHFIEYFVLGAECAGVVVAITGRAVSPYLWTDLFVVLAVAVCDECVQLFAGRTSLVTDVLLDFSGALVGIGVVTLIAAVALRKSRYVPGRVGRHARVR